MHMRAPEKKSPSAVAKPATTPKVEQGESPFDKSSQSQAIQLLSAKANAGSVAAQLTSISRMADGTGTVQRLASLQQQAVMQGKGLDPSALLQSKQATGPLQRKAGGSGGGGTSKGLPDKLKSGVERLSGHSMDDVRVNYNSDQPAQLAAHAFAQGTDIHVAPGQERHLPHEAWHVAQQKQGRVKATTQMKGKVPVNDDASLEREADVMGARAMSLGGSLEPVMQARAVSTRIGVVQREGEDGTAVAPATETEAPSTDTAAPVDPVLMESITQNRGLIEMAKNAQAILADSGIWATVSSKPSGMLDLAVAGGGATGGLTSIAGAATNAIDGTSGKNAAKVPGSGVQTDFVDQAAGNIVAAVGAGISGLFSAVKAARNIYAAAKNKDMVAGTAGARDLLATLQSGFICAQEVLKYVSGSVPTGIASAIPGLGIAVSAANIIVNAYNGLKAKSAEAEMLVVSDAYRQDLKALLGRNPEDNSKLMDTEKRGKLGSRVEYLRLTVAAKAAFANMAKQPDPDAEFDKVRSVYGIPPAVTFAEFMDAVRKYELGSKLQEINQKRKVYSGREIAADLVSIAGDIAAFFPADGGITAVVLKGASSGAKAAQSLGKAVQGFARDHDILGGDTTRSSTVKHAEYVGHTRTIYTMLAGVGMAGKEDSAITAADITKARQAERMIEAAGASTSVIYNTNYSSKASMMEQVNAIIEAMKKGR